MLKKTEEKLIKLDTYSPKGKEIDLVSSIIY